MIFNTKHYASRLVDAGISVARAEAAVAIALVRLCASMEIDVDVVGRVRVDGRQLEYRARLHSDGSIRIGTIFPVK